MTKEKLLQILDLAEQESITEREASYRILGKVDKGLYYWKRKYGIPLNFNTKKYTRKHKVNDSYFVELTNQNCYWGGFIAADGNVAKSNGSLTISLQKQDSNHLQTFLDHLNSDYLIHYGKSKQIYEYAHINICSEEIMQDLKKWFNIVPAKSLILKEPNIDWNDKALIDSYIIGLIDGDGSIGWQKVKNKSDRFYIHIVGTPEVLNFVKRRFEEILGKSTSNLHFDSKFKGNTCTIRVSDLNARILFLHFYNIPIYKLERKWSKEKYDYCVNFKKACPISRRKGVNIFDLDGKFIKRVNTLQEAEQFTGSSYATISKLCKLNDNKHMSNGYMFSRDREKMEKYSPSNSINHKYLRKFLNKEQALLDAGEGNIEDEN